jgi:hypothetical protein
MAEGRRMLRREVGTGPFGVEVDHPDVAQLGGALDQGVEEECRSRRSAVEVDLVAAPDPGDRLGWADDPHGVSFVDRPARWWSQPDDPLSP